MLQGIAYFYISVLNCSKLKRKYWSRGVYKILFGPNGSRTEIITQNRITFIKS